MSTALLTASGLLGVVAACIHGYLGQTRLLARASFPNRQSRQMVGAIWHLSTATWLASALLFAAAPWMFEAEGRRWVVGAACLPILWGVVANAWVTRGRHAGWMVFAVVVTLAAVGAALP